MSARRDRSRRLWLLIALAVVAAGVIALAITEIGGGGKSRSFARRSRRAARSSASVAVRGSAAVSRRANITKYVTCVRQHGYNLPDPNFSGKGPIFPANIQNNAKFRTASRACQGLLVPPRPSGSGSGSSSTAGA